MLLPITKGAPEVKLSAVHYITIPRQVYIDLCAIVDHYDTEVSGCGMVERIEHRFKGKLVSDPDIVELEFKIHEIFLPNKQDNTLASTNIEDEEIHKLQTELLKQNKDTELLRLHWHSHADMSVFHSGTDEDNYATLSNGDFLVSLVLNKDHEFLGRVDYFKPIRVSMKHLTIFIDVEVKDIPSINVMKDIDKLDEYVKSKKTVTVTYNERLFPEGLGLNDNITDDKESAPLAYRFFDEDMEVAKQLGIKREDAMRYRNCAHMSCITCLDSGECMEYLYHIDRLPGNI